MPKATPAAPRVCLLNPVAEAKAWAGGAVGGPGL